MGLDFMMYSMVRFVVSPAVIINKKYIVALDPGSYLTPRGLYV